MRDKNYNVGIVGLGIFGKEHLNVLSKLHNVNIIGVCDIDNEKLEFTKDNYPIKHFYNDIESLIGNNEIDTIHITSNENTHYDIAMLALEHNKNLYIEKPLAITIKEAYKIRNKAKNKNLKISIGHLLRYDNRHEYINNSIKKGEIGQILAISLRRNYKKEMIEHYGRLDPFLNAMIHDVDLIQFFTNENLLVDSSKQYYNHMNSSFVNTANLMTESGIPCFLENIWLLPNNYPFGMEFEVNIYGEKGFLRTRSTPHVESYSSDCLYPDLSLEEALERKLKNSIDYFIGDSNENSPTIDEAVHSIEIASHLKGDM